MPNQLNDKTALVTGGSRGIGRAIVQRLATDGAAVAFTYLTDDDAAADVVAAVADDGGRAWAIRADASDPQQVQDAFSEAAGLISEAGLGGLDIVVNNAGVMNNATIADTSVEDFDRLIAINTRGAFVAIKHAARALRDGGRIVNISTIGTSWPSPGEGAYAASKGALEQLSRVASRELGRRQITVNAVSPGPIETDLALANSTPEAMEGAAQMTALGRIGQPADIAAVVAFLVGRDGAWVTGQNIRADGGLA